MLLTRPPLTQVALDAFDLHVLGTPPAFILSQDQTRHPSYVTSSLPKMSCVCEDKFVTQLDRLNLLLLVPYHSSVVQVHCDTSASHVLVQFPA